MEEELIRRRLRITGRVQGVFFRATVRQVAEREGATGWARNAPDGSVEVEVQGDPAAVATLEGWCRQGPAQARVVGVAVQPVPVVEGESRFEVR